MCWWLFTLSQWFRTDWKQNRMTKLYASSSGAASSRDVSCGKLLDIITKRFPFDLFIFIQCQPKRKWLLSSTIDCCEISAASWMNFLLEKLVSWFNDLHARNQIVMNYHLVCSSRRQLSSGYKWGRSSQLFPRIRHRRLPGKSVRQDADHYALHCQVWLGRIGIPVQSSPHVEPQGEENSPAAARWPPAVWEESRRGVEWISRWVAFCKHFSI